MCIKQNNFKSKRVQHDSDQQWITIDFNVIVKNAMYRKKNYIWNLSACGCKNGKYLASIIDHSAITCDDAIESYNKEKNFNKNKGICNTQNKTSTFHFCFN